MTSARDDARRQLPQLFCFGFDGLEPPARIRAFLAGGGGGYILFRRNIDTLPQLLELNRELRALGPGAGPFAMVDQEGGLVRRLGDLGSPVPDMAALGATGSRHLARRIGRLLGREVRAAGFNTNCAPVLDVHTRADNPIIGRRALSADPAVVGELGHALMVGLHEGGVLACAKHFPGHGDTALDSHVAAPRLPHGADRLTALELAPFRAAMARQELGLVMSAHVVYEGLDAEHPATLSPVVLSTLLRRELRFDGVVVTDDLDMAAIADRYPVAEVVRRGLEGEVDLFLFCRDPQAQIEALEAADRLVAEGVVAPERVARSIRRIARVKCFLRGAEVPPLAEAEATLRSAEHLGWLAEIPAAAAPPTD